MADMHCHFIHHAPESLPRSDCSRPIRRFKIAQLVTPESKVQTRAQLIPSAPVTNHDGIDPSLPSRCLQPDFQITPRPYLSEASPSLVKTRVHVRTRKVVTMDPASIIGVVAAAAQFADTTRKLAKFIKEIHAGTEVGPTKRRLIQLETWAEVAEKIRDSGEQNDPQTEKIMKLCIPTVEALATHLGRIQISEGDGRREKTRKAFLARWEKDDIADLFAQLHRDQMILLTYRSFAFEDRLLQKIRDSIGSHSNERLEHAKQYKQSTLEKKFLKAIFITDPQDDRRALALRKTPRVKGTCAWITKTDSFLDWMSTAAPSPGLIIEGGPGNGKSMIAIYLTEFLENFTQTSEAGTESVLYFFCDNLNPRQNNALAVIRCLVWQLCQLRPCLLHHGTKEIEARGDVKHLLQSPAVAVETLWRIFISMLADDRAGTVSCVVDGLDECDETSILSVLAKFHEFWTGHQTLRFKFKFLILSRPLSLRCQPLVLGTPKVCLDPDLNEGDVTIFIEQCVNELARANPVEPWRDSRVKKVMTTLLKKAGGTFLWVGFVTDEMRGKQGFEAEQCLEALPQGLHGVYDRILLSMPRVHWFKIRSILHWICLAEHPLRRIQLAGLIHDESADDDGASATISSMASDSDSHSTSDTDPDMDELNGLLEYCKAIVKIAEDDSVHFVHQSVKDYFMRTDHIGNPNLDYFVVGNLRHAHEKMALRCIEFMEDYAKLLEEATSNPHSPSMKRASSSGYVDTDEAFPNRLFRHERSSTSVEYAAGFWVHHVRCSGKEYHDAATAETILRFLDKKRVSLFWFSVYCVVHGFDHWKRFVAEISVLRLAMMLGLGTTTRLLIQSMSIDDYLSTVRDGQPHLIRSGLHFDQLHIIEILLDRYGNEIISKDPDGPLCSAVREGKHRAVQMLLALPPSPREVHGEDLDKALVIATIQMSETGVIIELLNAGATPCTITDNCGLLKLFLQLPCHLYGGIVDGQVEGQVEVVRLMLERGAGADLKSTHSGETVLHMVASRHNYPVASLLLHWGAPINAVDSNGATPLHCAAAITGEDARICELLITAGQASATQNMSDGGPQIITWNIDSLNFQGQSALLLASRSAWPEAIGQLLKAGADPNLRDRNGQGPITLVICHLLDSQPFDLTKHSFSLFAWFGEVEGTNSRCITCVKLLGAVVANCNEQDVEGRTAIHILAQLMNRTQRLQKRTYRAVLQILEVLRGLGIDESLKDASGKVARDYYPRDVLWRKEEDHSDNDSLDRTSS